MTPLPGVTPTKPGSATLPFFGVDPVVVVPETGVEVKGNSIEGALCLRKSWPGQARTIYKDHQRFVETYFTQYKGLYFTGDAVTEAAVVGTPHEIKGVGIYAYVILDHSQKDTPELMESIKDVVRKSIGRFAAPDVIHVTKGLPKTRSGKVMRRILRKIASHEYDGLGDISTLSDPSVVEILVNEHKILMS